MKPDPLRVKLSTKLQPLYDLELALGNEVDSFPVPDLPGFPLVVKFMKPLHRTEFESRQKLDPHLKWLSIETIGGYVDEDTHQSIQGPQDPSRVIMVFDKTRLTPALQPIYDFELAQGNRVVRIDEQAWTECPLAVVFKNPLHKTEIDAKLSPPPHLHWFEDTDPHYSVDGEGGYKCSETGHAIIGSLAPKRL
jgi:hypothetical protein